METTHNSVKVKLGIKGNEIGEKTDQLGSCCICNWSRIRMSFNIIEKDTSYCLLSSPYRPQNFLNGDLNVPRGIPVGIAFCNVAWLSEQN